MADQLSWGEIKVQYPDEWVVLVDYDLEGDVPTRGVVLDHGRVKREVYDRLRSVNEECFVLFTGRMRRDLVMGGLGALIAVR